MQPVTLEEFATTTLEVFWKQESQYINQMLHRLMGKKRLLVLKGEIIGVAAIDLRHALCLITSRDARFCRLPASSLH